MSSVCLCGNNDVRFLLGYFRCDFFALLRTTGYNGGIAVYFPYIDDFQTVYPSFSNSAILLRKLSPLYLPLQRRTSVLPSSVEGWGLSLIRPTFGIFPSSGALLLEQTDRPTLSSKIVNSDSNLLLTQASSFFPFAFFSCITQFYPSRPTTRKNFDIIAIVAEFFY